MYLKGKENQSPTQQRLWWRYKIEKNCLIISFQGFCVVGYTWRRRKINFFSLKRIKPLSFPRFIVSVWLLVLVGFRRRNWFTRKPHENEIRGQFVWLFWFSGDKFFFISQVKIESSVKESPCYPGFGFGLVYTDEKCRNFRWLFRSQATIRLLKLFSYSEGERKRKGKNLFVMIIEVDNNS